VSHRLSFVVGRWQEARIGMTLEELENALPNGLHDAEVRQMSVDYEQRNLAIDVDIWVGNMTDSSDKREAYRKGRIEISGLLFLVMEPPDARYPFAKGNLRIDGCDLSKNLDKKLLDSLPSEAFFRSLWISEWNAFIHIAAAEARISWKDEAVIYRDQEQPHRRWATGETID
jgi:hypothetical protein